MYRKGNRDARKQSELEGKSQSWSLRVIASVGLMVHPRRGCGQHLNHSLDICDPRRNSGGVSSL